MFLSAKYGPKLQYFSEWGIIESASVVQYIENMTIILKKRTGLKITSKISTSK
jgi:hypothetical protein